MRTRRSTAVQSTLLISTLLHGAALAAWLLWTPSAAPSQPSAELEVYNVSAQELAEMTAGAAPLELPTVETLPAPNTVQHLSPEALAALPKDPEPLPQHKPSTDAVTQANGQIVEIATPDQPQPAPNKADYLAAANVRVAEEQASRQYRLNPEVLAPTFSDKNSLAHPSEGEAKARMRGEQNGQHGEAGGAQGAQASVRLPEAETRPSGAPRIVPASLLSAPPFPPQQSAKPASATPTGPSPAQLASLPPALRSPDARTGVTPEATAVRNELAGEKTPPGASRAAPEPVPLPLRAPEAPATTTRPDFDRALLDEWGTASAASKPAPTPRQQPVSPASITHSPLLARLDASLRPAPTPLATPTPEALTSTALNPTSSHALSHTQGSPASDGTFGRSGTSASPGLPSGETQVASLGTAGPSGPHKGQDQGGGDGGTAPVTFRQGELRGAPSNDRLNEKRGESTLLNAREFKYFGYMQLIRRQVNFYWSQSLDNITAVQERLNRNEYTTVLNITLDAKGNLKQSSMVRSCGVKRFDEATMQAFRIAAPFPPPPEGLLNASGEAVLPEFAFTVNLAAPAPRYSGIDPRSNVLFPGIVRP